MKITDSDLHRDLAIACCQEAYWASASDPREPRWIVWNVVHDSWYELDHIDKINRYLNDALKSHAATDIPRLLWRASLDLQLLRNITPNEQSEVASRVYTFQPMERFGRKYILSNRSRFRYGAASREVPSSLLRNDSVTVTVRVAAHSLWVTFATVRRDLPVTADEIARGVGLPWAPSQGNIVRIEIQRNLLANGGFHMFIPTFFNSVYELKGRAISNPDWRARAELEKRPNEPWGHARDMVTGDAGLPELMLVISTEDEFQATVLDPLTVDYSVRPYLNGMP